MATINDEDLSFLGTDETDVETAPDEFVGESHVRFGIRLPVALVKALDDAAKILSVKRNHLIEDAIRTYTGNATQAQRERASRNRVGQLREASEDNIEISRILDRAIYEELKNRPGALSELDDKSLATIAISRAPKPKDTDEDITQSYQSLAACLEKLPDHGDLARELGQARNQLKKLELDLYLAKQMLRPRLSDVSADKDFLELLTGYMKDCVARGVIPEKVQV